MQHVLVPGVCYQLRLYVYCGLKRDNGAKIKTLRGKSEKRRQAGVTWSCSGFIGGGDKRRRAQGTGIPISSARLGVRCLARMTSFHPHKDDRPFEITIILPFMTLATEAQRGWVACPRSHSCQVGWSRDSNQGSLTLSHPP